MSQFYKGYATGFGEGPCLVNRFWIHILFYLEITYTFPFNPQEKMEMNGIFRLSGQGFVVHNKIGLLQNAL